MNITRDQREGGVSILCVTVGEADYAADVEKELRNYRRKANIPGFRPGMVPMGIVKKMYGKGVLAEQSYRKASNAVFEYLQKEGIDYLGDVIPSEEQGASTSTTRPNSPSSSRSARRRPSTSTSRRRTS